MRRCSDVDHFYVVLNSADGPDHNVRRALKQFDEDEKNAVTAMQFVKGMERFGLHITESEAKGTLDDF